jgi:hypothetical protein
LEESVDLQWVDLLVPLLEELEGLVVDGVTTGIESSVKGKYVPSGHIAGVTNIVRKTQNGENVSGELFDTVVGVTFDGLLGKTAGKIALEPINFELFSPDENVSSTSLLEDNPRVQGLIEWNGEPASAQAQVPIVQSVDFGPIPVGADGTNSVTVDPSGSSSNLFALVSERSLFLQQFENATLEQIRGYLTLLESEPNSRLWQQYKCYERLRHQMNPVTNDWSGWATKKQYLSKALEMREAKGLRIPVELQDAGHSTAITELKNAIRNANQVLDKMGTRELSSIENPHVLEQMRREADTIPPPS